jgi:Bacterial SH3 domain
MSDRHEFHRPGLVRYGVAGRFTLAALVCLTISQFVAGQTPGNDATPDERVPREFQGFVPDSGHVAVIDDPDGYVNVRARPDAESPIVTKVNKGERFTFQRKDYDRWCSVKLASGKTGWMDAQRILLFFTKGDLPGKPTEGDEVDEQARHHGINYYEVTQGAVRGDAEAVKKFFAVGGFADSAGAEEHEGVISIVVHLIGDDALSKILKNQPIGVRVSVRNSMDDGNVTYPFRSPGYWERHFPKTTKLLFLREVTDWPSPDGRYAFHKKFSDEFTDNDSKVIKAELIEKKTGKVIVDLRREDIGAGRSKEGEVLWSLDSKHFAYSSFGASEVRLSIFRSSGAKFVKVDLPSPDDKIPDPANDPELKDTNVDGEMSDPEPMRWAAPNVIAFRKHLLYQPKDKPAEYADEIHRRYEIAMTIGDDGKVTTDCKLIKEGD